MFSAVRTWVLATSAGLMLLAAGQTAQAGWVTFKNDSSRTLVLQKTVTCQGRPKRCKPIQLLPGESVREFIAPQSITLDLYDSRNTAKRLRTATLDVVSHNQTVALSEHKGNVLVSSIPAK